MDDYKAECEAREKAREARYREQERRKLAQAIYRDMLLIEMRKRVDEGSRASDLPLDFAAEACNAIEAAEAMMKALDNSQPPTLPDYEA